MAQTVTKEAQHLTLKDSIKVNQDVSTDDDIHIMMPVMDGYETMRRIRKEKRWEMLPIIALTAKAMPEDQVKCIESGANDYLTKPLDLEKLLSLMRMWLFTAV